MQKIGQHIEIDYEKLGSAMERRSLDVQLRRLDVSHLNITKHVADLESDEMTANGMISAEGEIVLLKNCVLRGGEVEEWVNFFLLFNTRCVLLKNK